jgi:uncharacterized membrane protein YhaH (DUF805 family)
VSLSDYLFNLDGRVNRAKYWLYVVVSAAILMVFFVVVSLVFANQLYDPRGGFSFPLESWLDSGSFMSCC